MIRLGGWVGLDLRICCLYHTLSMLRGYVSAFCARSFSSAGVLQNAPTWHYTLIPAFLRRVLQPSLFCAFLRLWSAGEPGGRRCALFLAIHRLVPSLWMVEDSCLCSRLAAKAYLPHSYKRWLKLPGDGWRQRLAARLYILLQQSIYLYTCSIVREHSHHGVAACLADIVSSSRLRLRSSYSLTANAWFMTRTDVLCVHDGGATTSGSCAGAYRAGVAAVTRVGGT